jgi:protein SDA1
MAAIGAAASMESMKDRIISLPSLQSLMKKDPEAYVQEFTQQWSHFESMMEIFKLKPQKPEPTFNEQVMFLAHVAPSFKEKSAELPKILIAALSEHFEVMHSQMRQTLVQALILLRNRNQFPCIDTVPLYFKLFSLQDKGLRNQVFTHLIRDIADINKKTKNQKVNQQLRDIFFARLKDGEQEVSRRACAAFISLYRQNVWRDAGVVNLMSAGLVHPDTKIAAALTHLFLGNKTKGLEGILDESDEEDDEEELNEALKHIQGSKKSGKKAKRLQNAKKAVKKNGTKRKHKEDMKGQVSFVAIDMLHDPHTLSERLLQRVSKGGEPFLFRLLILHLAARLVSRHQLLLLNMYPFILKYLSPTQHEVTKVLACLVEASHSLVPPEELRPVVLHVMRSFVNEAQAPEVIEVGLNAIREICSRAVNVLEEEELGDLAGFRKFKNKGVAIAAKSLINTYRELHPQLLQRSLRGRTATMAMSRGECGVPLFGLSEATDRVDGIEMLVKAKRKRSREDGDEGEQLDPAQRVEAGKQMLSEKVLGPEDFKQLQKLRLQKSIERQLGKKRKLEDISSSGSEGDDDSDAPSTDGERGMPGRMPDAISAGELAGAKKKGRGKADRLKSIKAGRTDYTEKLKEMRSNRKGGKTNAEQRRNKPLMMSLQSASVRKKKAQGAKMKVRTLKAHIKTLEKTKNHQKIRRA